MYSAAGFFGWGGNLIFHILFVQPFLIFFMFLSSIFKAKGLHVNLNLNVWRPAADPSERLLAYRVPSCFAVPL